MAGGLDVLAHVLVPDVEEVLFISGLDATTRFGIGHQGDALLVRTRRGAPSGGCGG